MPIMFMDYPRAGVLGCHLDNKKLLPLINNDGSLSPRQRPGAIIIPPLTFHSPDAICGKTRVVCVSGWLYLRRLGVAVHQSPCLH